MSKSNAWILFFAIYVVSIMIISEIFFNFLNFMNQKRYFNGGGTFFLGTNCMLAANFVILSEEEQYIGHIGKPVTTRI